jgi:hypothetical protein
VSANDQRKIRQRPEIVAVIGVVGAFIAGITALTVTGSLGRVQRNHEIGFTIALGLLILGAGAVAVGARLADGKTKTAIGIGGAACSLAGLVLGYGLTIATASETERPRLDVGFDLRRLTVTGTVTAEDLSTTDGLEVHVDGLIDFDHDIDTLDPSKAVTLSRAVVGPNSDGKATQRIGVPLPHGAYDAVAVTASVGSEEESCGLNRRAHVDGGTACITLPLPRRLTHPALTAAWGRREAGMRVVVVKTVGRDLNAGSLPQRPLLLRAVGVRHGRMRPLYRAVIDPVARGVTRQTVRVRVPDGVSVVCAGTTRMVHRAIACPIRGSDRGAVELHAARSVPRR